MSRALKQLQRQGLLVRSRKQIRIHEKPLHAYLETDTLEVDRKALPKPEGLRPVIAAPYAAPRNSVEEALAKIWAEVLEFDHVGIHPSVSARI